MTKNEVLSVEALNKEYKHLKTEHKFSGVVPTGSVVLDYLLGCNGWCFGHMHEIYGPESSGKTTLVMHALAEAQKMGIKPLFIDQERTFNRQYANDMNINTDEDKLLMYNPNSLEEGLEMILKYARTGDIKLIAVDSIAAMIPQITFDDPDNKQPGIKGKILSNWLPIFIQEVYRHNICVLFVNQTRAAFNTGWVAPGQETDTVTSGNAIRFYYSTRVRIDVASVPSSETTVWNEMLYREEKVKLYQKSRLTIKKNKIKSPQKRDTVLIKFGEGVDNTEFVNDLLKRMGIVEVKRGGFGEYRGKSGFKFRGKDEFKNKLRSDKKLYQECMEYIPWYNKKNINIGDVIKKSDGFEDKEEVELTPDTDSKEEKKEKSKRGRKKVVDKIEA